MKPILAENASVVWVILKQALHHLYSKYAVHLSLGNYDSLKVAECAPRHLIRDIMVNPAIVACRRRVCDDATNYSCCACT